MSNQMTQTLNNRFINLNILRLIALVLAVVLTIWSAHAADHKTSSYYETEADLIELPLKKETRLGLYLISKESYKHVTENPDILFLDVRTRAEVNFLGLPDVADANIPVKPITTILASSGLVYQRVDNSDFVPAVRDLIKRKKLGLDPVIFIMCRNGKGSAIAANLLADQGFNKVYSVIDGFEGDFDKNGKHTVNGWRNAGLPWSYGIGKERAYNYQPKAISWLQSF